MNKPRSTFEMSFKFDKELGMAAWKWIVFYNGFTVSFGLLGMSFRVQYVKNNYGG